MNPESHTLHVDAVAHTAQPSTSQRGHLGAAADHVPLERHIEKSLPSMTNPALLRRVSQSPLQPQPTQQDRWIVALDRHGARLPP